MTSEDQINKGLASNSGSASESQEELYPDSPTKISDATEAGETRRRLPNKDSTLLSLPSRLRLPTILVHRFARRAACKSAIAKTSTDKLLSPK